MKQLSLLKILFIVVTNISFSQSILDSSYFPLKIGNQWTYLRPISSFAYDAQQKVVDTTTINGFKYFNVDLNIINYYNQPESINVSYRNSFDSIFVKADNSPEYLLYNFNATIGDTIVTNSQWFGAKIILVSKTDTVSTVLGKHIQCYHFKHLDGGLWGSLTDSWFTKGIGGIKFSVKTNPPRTDTWMIRSSSLVTSLKELHSAATLSSHLLIESYPNPFNSQTILKYRIDRTSQVSIDIFDLLGRKIDTLVNEIKNDGDYYVSWNAEGFPSGLYFAVLRSSNYLLTVKIILQK